MLAQAHTAHVNAPSITISRVFFKWEINDEAN